MRNTKQGSSGNSAWTSISDDGSPDGTVQLWRAPGTAPVLRLVKQHEQFFNVASGDPKETDLVPPGGCIATTQVDLLNSMATKILRRLIADSTALASCLAFMLSPFLFSRPNCDYDRRGASSHGISHSEETPVLSARLGSNPVVSGPF